MSQPPKLAYLNAAQARAKAKLAREQPGRDLLEAARRKIESAVAIGREATRLDITASLADEHKAS